ncbi:hypothetical protein ATCC53582_02689 [Novacetimonas hansenii]|uniref:hypothetical protein n=1 Tax=Novacetimonas hansenii TaxID=436 RepID=UPI00079C73F6|nr:hypothetical protein [Novacetimonas hansenii]CUW48550.1 hypothetical protein ATCC53582_02689 [Novacetimonas hansenii]
MKLVSDMSINNKMKIYIQVKIAKIIWYFIGNMVDLRIRNSELQHITDFHMPLSEENKKYLMKTYPKEFF